MIAHAAPARPFHASVRSALREADSEKWRVLGATMDGPEVRRGLRHAEVMDDLQTCGFCTARSKAIDA